MKLLTRKLPASSLLETIVSSVIFMILFVMAMHALTRLLVHENKHPHHLVMESDMKKCKRMIEKEGVDENAEDKYYAFPWGKVKVSVSPYKGDILLIHITPEIEGAQQAGYHFLHVNP